jgi:hypothetical protein
MVDLPITTALIGGEQAVAGLNREEQALRRTTAATKSNTQAQAERAKVMSRWQRASAAAGSAGSAFGRVAGAVGLGGGLGAAAVGVAGLASMARLVSFYGRANITAIQDEIKARDAHTSAMRQAREIVRGQAMGYAGGGAKTEAALDAMGVARGQIQGSGGDAALLSLANAGQANSRNVSLVNEATATFLVSADEAAAAILKGARTAADILQTTHDRRFTSADVEMATARASQSRAAQAYADEDYNQLRINEDARSKALFSDALAKGLSKTFIDAADPALAKSRELIAENNKQLNNLAEALDKMGILETLVDRLSGEASVSRQFNRLAATQETLNAMPVDRSGSN